MKRQKKMKKPQKSLIHNLLGGRKPEKNTFEIPLENEWSRIATLITEAERGNECPIFIPPLTDFEKREWEDNVRICEECRKEGKSTADCIEIPPYYWFD